MDPKNSLRNPLTLLATCCGLAAVATIVQSEARAGLPAGSETRTLDESGSPEGTYRSFPATSHAATTGVPEPDVALIGGIGVLLLLRRRHR